MPNSSPTFRKPSDARELGKSGDIPPVLARKLLPLAVGAYFEDVFCAESSFLAKSGFCDFERLRSLLGFNASGRKDQVHLESMHLLGDEVTLLKNAIRTRATDERARKLRSLIAQALRDNYLTPSAASKLRGRLGFYASLHMGRLGRGMMGPLIRRQYGSYARCLTPEPERDLFWRHNAIGTLSPRSIPLTLFCPMGAHPDPQWRGHIATRALLPNDVSISTHLPKWCLEMAFGADADPPVYLFELAATVLTAC